MEVLLYRGCQTCQISIADGGMTQGVGEAVGARPSENEKGSQ